MGLLGLGGGSKGGGGKRGAGAAQATGVAKKAKKAGKDARAAAPVDLDMLFAEGSGKAGKKKPRAGKPKAA
jgi:hypothetical protein